MPPVAKVLLVDDRPENLTALEAVLAGQHYQLVCAHSGTDALRQILAHDFALILMDVRMPGMDGYETAATIRKRARARHIPIIFLTASVSEPGHVHRGYAVGAADFMVKPFDEKTLRAKVGVFVDLYLQNQEILRQSAALERQADFIAGMMDAMPGALAYMDPAFVFRMVNQPFAALYGKRPDEMVGHPAAEVLPPTTPRCRTWPRCWRRPSPGEPSASPCARRVQPARATTT